MSKPIQDLQVGRTITWNGKLYLVTELDLDRNHPSGPGYYTTVIKGVLYDSLDPALYKGKPPRARAAKSKPATSDALTAKRKPKTPSKAWRKMSTAPLGTPIEVRFAGCGTDIRWRTVTVTLDEFGFWISKTYWARFTPGGHDRLDDWRPLSK